MKNGNEEMLMLPTMKPIEISNLNNWSGTRRNDGQIWLKDKKVMWRFGKEKQTFKKVAQEIAKKLRRI